MRSFAHISVPTIEAALAAMKDYEGKARLIAGGTDLFGMLKDEFLPLYPETIINIKTIADFDYIREEKGYAENRGPREARRHGKITPSPQEVRGPRPRRSFGGYAPDP
jgi:hypothetical protein